MEEIKINSEKPVDADQEVISLQEWLLTLFIAAIPIIGFIMLFVWGFGGGANRNKANWAKASLLLLVILFVFYILFALIFGSFFLMRTDSYA